MQNYMSDASETGTGFGADFCKCVMGIMVSPRLLTSPLIIMLIYTVFQKNM